MTTLEAKAELYELRGLADAGADLATYKGRLDALYWAVCQKHLRRCNCRDKYTDALVEIYAKLNTLQKSDMEKINSTARLVRGVVLFVNNKHYTNSNLTDDVAREFLSRFPQRKDWFEVLPSATTEKAVVAEVAEMPEKDSQIVSKAVKPASQTTTPKKKKKGSKRK